MNLERDAGIESSATYLSKTERLANYIRLKLEKMPPYVLLLGAGASTDSGYPDGAGFVKQFLELYRIPVESMGPDEQRTLFDQEWLHASPPVRQALMKSILPPRRPSQGYVALTRLIAMGAFDIILSLNPDDLLEQALANQGLPLRARDILDAVADNPQLIASKMGSRDPRIKIVKLHGDFRSGKFAFTRDETAEFKPNVRQLVQQQLLQDVISFGTTLGDQDIRDCLDANTDNSFWFVSGSAPDSYVTKLLFKRASIPCEITGSDAEFDRFFPRLLACVQGTALEPGVFEAEFGAMEDHDLSRIFCLKGPYGHGRDGIFLGSPEEIAALLITDLWLANCKVNVRLRIADYGADEGNWVGFQVRANSPQYGDGFLVYLRASGNVDLYSRLRGFGGVISTARHVASAGDWTELELEIHNNKIEILVNGDPAISLEDPNIVGKQGSIYLLTHCTRSYLSRLRISPL